MFEVNIIFLYKTFYTTFHFVFFFLYVRMEKTMTDEELFEMMKTHPEFKNLPLPASWFKKFNLEPVKARNFKEFIESNAYFVTRGMHVDESEIRKDPAPGGVRPVAPPEEIPMTITSRNIEPTEIWGILPTKPEQETTK